MMVQSVTAVNIDREPTPDCANQNKAGNSNAIHGADSLGCCLTSSRECVRRATNDRYRGVISNLVGGRVKWRTRQHQTISPGIQMTRSNAKAIGMPSSGRKVLPTMRRCNEKRRG